AGGRFRYTLTQRVDVIGKVQPIYETLSANLHDPDALEIRAGREKSRDDGRGNRVLGCRECHGRRLVLEIAVELSAGHSGGQLGRDSGLPHSGNAGDEGYGPERDPVLPGELDRPRLDRRGRDQHDAGAMLSALANRRRTE